MIPEEAMNEIMNVWQLPGGRALQIVLGDITLEHVDAIVNAANTQLQHGGGVAAAIVRRGGPVIQIASDAWVQEHGPVTNAEPAYTTGGRLPCRYVIHAVGPVWGEGDEDKKLAAAITGSLRLADQLELNSIAFPAISTGIYGFPKERAAKVILLAMRNYFKEHIGSGLRQVRMTLFDQEMLKVFSEAGELGTGQLENLG
jgi:O-acetyl-ADP-ribose deacetylase (regulator of RNase III)